MLFWVLLIRGLRLRHSFELSHYKQVGECRNVRFPENMFHMGLIIRG